MAKVACIAKGGMCGRGMHGRGYAWQGAHAWQERQSLQRTVRILLECILVSVNFDKCSSGTFDVKNMEYEQN